MKLFLKPYTNSWEYPDIYTHNFGQINAIENDKTFSKLITMLANFSGIEKDIVLLELKRYIMISKEYFPSHLKISFLNIFLLPYFVLYVFINMFTKKLTNTDIIIDKWYEESIESFYGNELLDVISTNHRSLFVHFNGIKHIGILVGIEGLTPFLKAFFLCTAIMKSHGIDIRRFIFIFFRNCLIGKTLGKESKPRLIISGNDNGFPVIVAKAAKAELMLIQNAKRLFVSDSCFKFADYLIAMSDNSPESLKEMKGCLFKEIYPLGSLRLYYTLKTIAGKKMENKYDILWVSELCSKNSDYNKFWSQVYSLDTECEAIKLLIAYAENNSVKIAYQCQFSDEVRELEEMGLKSTNINYIAQKDQSVYTALFQSRIVLSPYSTVCTEAMKLGKKVGFVNLSGNDNINYAFRHLDIEFNLKSGISFEDFINKITNWQGDYGDFAVQDLLYIPSLVKIIKNTLGINDHQ